MRLAGSHNRTIAALLALALLALAPAAAPAQDDIAAGGVDIRVAVGYNGCALPVAGNAVGRQMALGDGLRWQLAANYSVVPVRVDFYQRQAIAFKGRVEIRSNDGYAPSEDPDRHATTLTRDILVPPSTHMSIFLLPRLAPRSQPGWPVQVEVRLYQGENQTPLRIERLGVTQLEPAWLYSLMLTDGEPETVAAVPFDAINPGNALGLELPPSFVGGRQPPYVGILTFQHYLVACNRLQVTGAPLAARDFAFVCADAQLVMAWPPDEQQALVSFMLAGGHLCLYNAGADASWQGLSLAGAQGVGRGFLLSVPGDVAAARSAMTRWLSGELEEFVLWSRGKVAGHGLEFSSLLPPGTGLAQQIGDRVYAAPGDGAGDSDGVVSHEPGYLNPIWIYREACRQSALEPWDYPEFTASFPPQEPGRGFGPLLQNSNLRMEVLDHDDRLQVEPMFKLAQPNRHAGRKVPLLFAGLLVLSVMAVVRPRYWSRRLGVAQRSALLTGLVAGLGLWWLAQPVHVRATRMQLLDADTRCKGCVERSLAAMPTDRAGDFSLPVGSLLRYVRWDKPGPWTWRLPPAQAGASEEQGELHGAHGGAFVAVASDQIRADKPAMPIEFTIEHVSPGRKRLRIDTTGLPVGSSCVLMTPQGLQSIPAGHEYSAELALPRVGVEPGPQRLLAWQEFMTNRGSTASQLGAIGSVDRDGRAWQFAPAPDPLLRPALIAPDEIDSGGGLAQLGWVGLLQPLGGVRGFLSNQGVLLARLPQSDDSATFLRLTFPLVDSP